MQNRHVKMECMEESLLQRIKTKETNNVILNYNKQKLN